MLAFQQIQQIFNDYTFEEYKTAFEKYCEATGQSETVSNILLFDIGEYVAHALLLLYLKEE